MSKHSRQKKVHGNKYAKFSLGLTPEGVESGLKAAEKLKKEKEEQIRRNSIFSLGYVSRGSNWGARLYYNPTFQQNYDRRLFIKELEKGLDSYLI